VVTASLPQRPGKYYMLLAETVLNLSRRPRIRLHAALHRLRSQSHASHSQTRLHTLFLTAKPIGQIPIGELIAVLTLVVDLSMLSGDGSTIRTRRITWANLKMTPNPGNSIYTPCQCRRGSGAIQRQKKSHWI
jgi:hypothetical protein